MDAGDHRLLDPPAHPLDLKPGTEFAGHTIASPIHRGADGELYAARDAHGFPCCLKIPLDQGLGSLRRYVSFRTEWELAGSLNHRHVVGFRRGNGRFLVLDLLSGPDLRSRLQEGKPLRWDEAEKYLVQVCQALAYLHSRGVVHHDIKPENIVLDRDQGLKLVDFGLAYCTDLDDPLGVIPGPLGTPDYIAPEQLEGIRGHPTSDMYSLGVVLYEMLTGELPFARSSTRSDARKRLYVDPKPPRILRPDLPCGIQELLLLLLDRDPFARPKASSLCQAVVANIDWETIACVTPERSAFDRWMDHFRIWRAPRYREFLTPHPAPVQGYHILAVIDGEPTVHLLLDAVEHEAKVRNGMVSLMAVVPFNLTDLDREQTERSMIRAVDAGLQRLVSQGIRCRFRIKEGDPEVDILEYARSRHVDLVAIAQGEATGMRKIISTRGLAGKLVQSAATNVLVVKK